MTVNELYRLVELLDLHHCGDAEVLVFNGEFNTYEPCDGLRMATVTRTDMGLGVQYMVNKTGASALLIGSHG